MSFFRILLRISKLPPLSNFCWSSFLFLFASYFSFNGHRRSYAVIHIILMLSTDGVPANKFHFFPCSNLLFTISCCKSCSVIGNTQKLELVVEEEQPLEVNNTEEVMSEAETF